METWISKEGKIDIFAKWIVHDFFLKKFKFFHVLVVSKIDREKLFAEVLEKKKPLKTIKKGVYEKLKIRIFANGLVHGFSQIFKISLTLIFMQNRPRKSIWERSR